MRRGRGLISHVIITATLHFEGIEAPGETKVRSISDACATHVNVCEDMTLNSALKHTPSLRLLSPPPSSPARKSPWAYQCIIAADWCIIAPVNLPVGG